jgi:hypothetical protein
MGATSPRQRGCNVRTDLREASGLVSLATGTGIGAPVWDFFRAHPLVFVVSLALVLLALLYLVRLLVFNAGPDSEFRLGILGLEYRRGQARARPRRPWLLKRAWRALKAGKPGSSNPVPGIPADAAEQGNPRSEDTKGVI